MMPAAFELLTRRLQVWDRKALHGAAMICAEQWNIARDRKEHPEAFTASDFLPETPEARAEREEDEERMRTSPETTPQFAAYKAGFTMMANESPAQKAGRAATAKAMAEAKRGRPE